TVPVTTTTVPVTTTTVPVTTTTVPVTTTTIATEVLGEVEVAGEAEAVVAVVSFTG
ncbi:MAG: serine/threonine protein kinase, partial [Actinobacteria bacterium]|nr:serine/threonine protein kinase [Actinomycetota bacterium]NCG38977.1 serine/threonine protein kinase [Actinomycetota bacterium]